MSSRRLNETGGGLLGILLSLLISPHVFAGEPCPPVGFNCFCAQNYCFRLLRINNPKYVHLQFPPPFMNDAHVNIRQGEDQQEIGGADQTFYVRRSNSGPTRIAVQTCFRPPIDLGASKCGPFVDLDLPEPSTEQLGFCQDYADKAAAAEKENVKLNCGYTGPRWATDPKANYNACAGNPGADLGPNETVARANDLQTCKNQKTAEAKPKDYNGSWAISTDQGGEFKLIMTQQGAVVTGQLINDNPQYSGTITGTMDADGKLAFKFVQPGIPASGEGHLWLEGDTDHLDARFTMDNSNGAVHMFNGTRR